jgi:argininosuccinate lyase
VDRERTAELLGFAGDPSNEATERSAARGSGGVVENAMDAVSARDFLVETTSAMATLSTTLSGMAEDLVVYSGRGYVEIGDEYASTSSIMPQKKNPDTLELVRASAGEATGALQGLLMTLKGLPRSYNIDLQEATPYAWTAVDVVPEALDVATGALVTAEWNEDVLTEAAKAGFATATGVADRLAMAGLPFRTAHEVVASAAETLEGHPDVATLEAAAQDVLDGSLTDYVDRETLAATLDPADSVGMRDSRGGPSPSAVSTSAARARERLTADRTAVADREATVAAAAETLDQEVTQYGTE